LRTFNFPLSVNPTFHVSTCEIDVQLANATLFTNMELTSGQQYASVSMVYGHCQCFLDAIYWSGNNVWHDNQI